MWTTRKKFVHCGNHLFVKVWGITGANVVKEIVKPISYIISFLFWLLTRRVITGFYVLVSNFSR